jgi:hypothetical protein
MAFILNKGGQRAATAWFRLHLFRPAQIGWAKQTPAMAKGSVAVGASSGGKPADVTRPL